MALAAAQAIIAEVAPGAGDCLELVYDRIGLRSSGSAYELVAQLGPSCWPDRSGAFGEVWQCTVLQLSRSGVAVRTRETRAVKIVRSSNVDAVRDEVLRHHRTVELAGAFFVPNFYEFAQGTIGTFSDRHRSTMSPCPAIVMQMIDGMAVDKTALGRQGSLMNVVVREMVAGAILHDVLVALGRLHSAGVVHRDVKPANVLVESSTGKCYLCDFGVSLFLNEMQTGQEMEQLGTMTEMTEMTLYMAPEMVKTMPTRYDAKVDVWALGVMGFEFDLGRTPLQASKGDALSQEIIFDTLQTMPTPTYETTFCPSYRELVQACLEVVPESRPSSMELLVERDLARRVRPNVEVGRRCLSRLTVSE